MTCRMGPTSHSVGDCEGQKSNDSLPDALSPFRQRRRRGTIHAKLLPTHISILRNRTPLQCAFKFHLTKCLPTTRNSPISSKIERDVGNLLNISKKCITHSTLFLHCSPTHRRRFDTRMVAAAAFEQKPVSLHQQRVRVVFYNRGNEKPVDHCRVTVTNESMTHRWVDEEICR